MNDLRGKNAIITGASKGIGKAVAFALANQGVNIVLAARTQSTLDETVQEIADQTKVKVIGVGCDVSKLEDLQKLVDTALTELGKIDILINNAGVSSQFPFENTPTSRPRIFFSNNSPISMSPKGIALAPVTPMATLPANILFNTSDEPQA